MNNQIVELRSENGTPAIPGVEFHENQLVISDGLNINVRELIRFLVAVEGCSLFWWGDLLNWLQNEYNAGTAIEAANQSSNPERLLEAMIVCGGLKTRKKVSFAHHREAYAETGQNSQEALLWISSAEAAGWSVSEMRRNIRASRAATNSPIQSKPSITLTSLLSSLKSRISSLTNDRPIDEWTLDEICAVKADLEPLEKFATQIRDRFNKFNPELVEI